MYLNLGIAVNAQMNNPGLHDTCVCAKYENVERFLKDQN